MAALELEGKLKTVLERQSGSGARGAWVRQDFVIEYQDGNYPAEACFSAWGQDKVDDLNRFRPGDAVKVAFTVKAREFNGRWYNDLRVWRLSPAQSGAQAAAPAARPAAPAQSAAPAWSAPAPTLDDMPADISEDDLPF